jgi:SAM-dependent methyltransferase
LNALFDQTLAAIRDGEVGSAMDRLIGGLHAMRNSSSGNEWRARTIPALRTHAVYPALLEDPFVRHSAVRPRGYAGDAELLDFIYASDNVRPRVDHASARGRELYRYSSATSITQAVRNRLSMSAQEADRIAESGRRPRVMSIACGHLREAGIMGCVREKSFGRFLAIDQDEVSLELVRQQWSDAGVEPVQMSARQLIRSDDEHLGSFDFIYVLGLYDYLSNETGAHLLRRIVEFLQPGGKAWIANFVPDLVPAAFMEGVMDWWLIYRQPHDLEGLSERIDPSLIASRHLFMEPENNVVFFEIVRA